MDYLSAIKQPIEKEYSEFQALFKDAMSHSDGLLSKALEYIRKQGGKQMRPLLILLIAKAFGEVDMCAQNAAMGIELLHTATLVHDDVVDESSERRGQASVNAIYNNKVSILVGDYVLSTALLKISQTRNHVLVDYIATLGQILSNGEILQLTSIDNKTISEEIYYGVIKQKTASLFEACAGIGAICAGKDDEFVEKCKAFGLNIGMAFQIRDDIFDYFDEGEIGKPTGNDMAEGKLTLPVIYALNSTMNEEMREIAYKVKQQKVSAEEIAQLVKFTKENGGIEYAEKQMDRFCQEAYRFIDEYVTKSDMKDALHAYVKYVSARNL